MEKKTPQESQIMEGLRAALAPKMSEEEKRLYLENIGIEKEFTSCAPPMVDPNYDLDEGNPVIQSEVTGIVPEHPKRSGRKRGTPKEDVTVTVDAKIKAVNAKYSKSKTNTYDASIKRHLGVKEDGTYEIPKGCFGSKGVPSSLNSNDLYDLFGMWVADDWENLRNPPPWLTIGHFIYALPEDMTSRKCHEHTMRATLSLKWSKYKTQPKDLPTRKVLEDYYENAATNATSFEYSLPRAIESVSTSISNLQKDFSNVMIQNFNLLREISQEFNRYVQGESSLTRGFSTKMAQLSELVCQLTNLTEDRLGEVMKKGPILSEVAESSSGLSSYQHSDSDKKSYHGKPATRKVKW